MIATAERLAELLQEAPAWARKELTASNPRVRDAAACELAVFVAERLGHPAPPRDSAQLALPL